LTDSEDEYHYDKDKKTDDFTGVPSDDDIDKALKKFSGKVRRLDESNPHEQAKKFRMVKQNPPHPDFMKVELHNGQDEQGRPGLYSRHVTLDSGKEAWVEHDPFFVFSPYIGFQANIAKAPMNAMDVLLDETELVAIEEKKAFKPEKRKDENNWSWILFVIMCVVGSVAGGVFLLMRFM